MTVGELIAKLEEYDDEKEIRIVDRNEGWDDGVYDVVAATYGTDPDTEVAVLLN